MAGFPLSRFIWNKGLSSLSDLKAQTRLCQIRRSQMSVSVKDVSAFEFNRAFAAFLKKSGKIKVPEWTDLAKQGRYKELSPTDQDWFYHRAASICRRMYIRAPVGVGQFRKVFGGRKRNGSAPSHFCISYKSLARRLIQALENLKMVEKDTNGGRRLTSQGKRDLDRIAAQLQPRKKARKTLK